MKTIEEHRQERAQTSYLYLRDTGVECPECQEELVETHPGCQTCSLPPLIRVTCVHCSWNGYINA